MSSPNQGCVILVNSYMKLASQAVIEFTPSWLLAAQVELYRGRSLGLQLSRVPLPAGCINEHSGVIEDPSKLKAALIGVKDLSWDKLGVGAVSLIVPPLLCFRSSFCVPERFREASTDRILSDCPLELPGNRDALIVAAHSHDPKEANDRMLMLIAARQSVIADYVGLFAGYEWAIDVITIGEISRFNRYALYRSQLKREVALVCSCNDDFYEFSVWDRGVLVASDTRKRSRTKRHEYDLDEIPLNSAILKIIERQRASELPITFVLFGGGLRGCHELQGAISAATKVTCGRSPEMESIFNLETALAPEAAYMSASGLLDDLTGVVMQSQRSQIGRRRSRWFR